MENDHALEIVGVDTIRLKMHDVTACKIQWVCHVMGLKMNLYFFGKLDDLRYKFDTESGILKVVKGNLVVMKA